MALLAGARDERVSLVLSVAGPVDHLHAMDPYLGWTTAETLRDVLRDGQVPGPTQEGGQDIDHFFDRVFDAGESLEDVRRRMIASSPLYFVENLPATWAYYGAEDRSVPLANAEMMRERLTELGRLGTEVVIRVFDDRGHDTDPWLVQQEITERLLDWRSRSH